MSTDKQDDDYREAPSPPLPPCSHHAEETKQRWKSALWFAVGKMVDNESLTLQLNATPQFIGSLTELVFAQIGFPPLTPTPTPTPPPTKLMRG